MSSRHLRKLKGKPRIDEELGHDADDVEDLDMTPTNPPRQANLFSLLNESLSETDVKEDDDVDTSAPAMLLSRSPGDASRKKKRKKRKATKRPQTASSEDNTVSEVDEVDASVREVNRLLGEIAMKSPVTEQTNSTIIKNVLSIERKHLNPDAEMRRLFGRDVVEPRRMARRRSGPGHHPRTFSMVTNVHRFPQPVKSGLSMELVERRGTEQWFNYTHSLQYQEIEHQFIAAVESVNPDNILALMNRYPGHVSSMLQLSEVCRLGEDLALSAELLERALYTLEAASHPLFSVTSGSTRLDYRRRENRPLFLALFRHARALSERGCHRTALEFCKLLLSLQPVDDPLGAVLILDHYALRAHEYQWLVRFQEQWEPVRNLSQLPSFSYSIPYCHLQLSLNTNSDKEQADRHRQMADEGLQSALLMFPTMLPLLLEKCEVTPAQEVKDCPLFQTSVEKSQPAALNLLCRLYAERSSHLWKPPDVISWLQQNASVAVQLITDQDPRVTEGQEARKKRYPGMPLSICRHVVISDVKEALGLLPPEVTSRPVVGHDPLPPTDGTAGYTLTRRTRGRGASNPLAAFFYSLLPNFDPNEDPDGWVVFRDEGAPAGAGAGAAAAADPDAPGGGVRLGEELRTSVTSLLDAMRDLLTNLSPPAATVDDDADLDESDDEAWADA